uniref:Amidase domain-containing protein n=1 Tax=Physcomitrium patens TaxID=3218 RepID=A0A2K1K082_PHYPA|nr:hypothetical protein PHYPA_014306 [Physcomitrium patens]
MATMVHKRPLAEQIAFPGLVEHYMSRIWQFDGEINAVVESSACVPEVPFPDNQTSPRSLEGLPFLVKDNVDVEGFHTVCGGLEFVGNPPADKDSKHVAILRQLGAIPIGKTNIPYLGQDVQTFNEVYGRTCNPHNLELSAGGSSGGSAAAVAAGMAAFATGSDWAGSLRIPAAFCGVSSLRASRGRMGYEEDDGIIPPFPGHVKSLTGGVLVTGILAKTVTDLKFVMDAVFPLIQGEELQDKRLTSSTDSNTAFTEGLNFGDKKMTSKLKQTFDEATNTQREEEDIVDAFFSETRFAALITPVCAILPHEHNFDHRPYLVNGKEVPYWRALTGYVTPFSVTGNPVVTMPLGVIDGKPLGIQVVGRRQQDEELLKICTLLEHQLGPIPNLVQHT